MTQLTRQELYDKIKQSSKQEYILKEMRRLGYWNDNDKPEATAELIQRKSELQTEINQLSREVQDPKAALKAIHKQRMADARQRRIDTKINADVKRYHRALSWHETQQNSITYLGNNSHIDKPNSQTDEDKALLKDQLKANGLPRCLSAKDLADAMGITINELRFLCYTDQVSQTTHYQRFAIQKKTGGTRLISAPMPRLKRLQYWVLDNILQAIPVAEQAHGFVPHKSIVTNAQPHLKKRVVINLDLKDFFPTISYPRIKGLFIKQGYPSEVATLLALICSEPDTQTVEMDGQRYYVHSKQRYLPQGAPTSPMISNLICRRLDKRLQGLANKYGFTYSRYADDLTFSSQSSEQITALLNWVRATIKEEGFILHPDKTRIMHQGSRQEVTGIVVNDQLSVNRKTLKQFRALLYQIDKDGYAGKEWGNKSGKLLPTIRGYAHYVNMVNPDKGQGFLQQIKAIVDKHGYPDSSATTQTQSTDFRQLSAQGKQALDSMSIATAKPSPDLDSIIQHHDVAEQTKQVLAPLLANLAVTSTAHAQASTHASSTSSSEASNTPSNTEDKQGVLSAIKSLLGGRS